MNQQYYTITSGTRHFNTERRHNLNTHMHAGTTPIILATSKTRHTVLPEDGPIGLKHVAVNDEILQSDMFLKC